MMCIKEKFNNKTTSKFQFYKITILIRSFYPGKSNKQIDTFKYYSNCIIDIFKRVGALMRERKLERLSF